MLAIEVVMKTVDGGVEFVASNGVEEGQVVEGGRVRIPRQKVVDTHLARLKGIVGERRVGNK